MAAEVLILTQDDILRIIKNEPGIETSELKKRADVSPGTVSQQVAALVLKGLIKRGPGKNRITNTLFPV